jgi:hypothetical protein
MIFYPNKLFCDKSSNNLCEYKTKNVFQGVRWFLCEGNTRGVYTDPVRALFVMFDDVFGDGKVFKKRWGRLKTENRTQNPRLFFQISFFFKSFIRKNLSVGKVSKKGFCFLFSG